MTHDARYTPPNAELADMDPTGPPRHRPVQVRWAVWLMVASFVLSLISGAILVVRGAEPDDLVVEAILSIVLVAVFAVIWASIVRHIYLGRHWARVVMLVLVALSALVSLWPMEDDGLITRYEVVLDSLALACDVAAMVLVFALPGSTWFKARD